MQVILQVSGDRGHPETLAVEADSEVDALRAAASRGLQVLSVSSPPSPRAVRGAAGRFPLVLFSQELLALLEAGLSLIEALQTLEAKERRPAPRAVLTELLNSLREGKGFSDALASKGQIFPELYVATVRSAERSGNLADALSRYVVYQLQFDALKKKLVSASIYPVMLIGVGLTVTLFLLAYVVPRFAAVYEGSGRETPLASRLLLAFGSFIDAHAGLLGAAALMAVTALVAALRAPAARHALVALAVQLPLLAPRAAEFRLARFYRTTSLLLAAGIPLTRALTMTTGLFPATQRASLDRARRAIEEGSAFTPALEAEGLATPIAASLLRVGERSGRLADMLERAARFHDEEFARWVDWASRLLEPLLMSVMGLVIGSVVVLLYMPIFDLAGTLQ